jgi:hypothetical protein
LLKIKENGISKEKALDLKIQTKEDVINIFYIKYYSSELLKKKLKLPSKI